jgi:hypothetical protein
MNCLTPIAYRTAICGSDHSAQPVRDPENKLWTLLRDAGEPLSIADIIRRSAIEPTIVTRWLRKWRVAGLIVPVGRQALLKMNGFAMRLSEPPVDLPSKPLGRRFEPSSPRQRIWTAVRVLQVFELPMLLITAETTMNTALNYLGDLVRAGYLERIDVRGAPHRKYRIALDTGPLHPAVSRVVLDNRPYTRVVDHNNGAQVHMALGPRGRPPVGKTQPASASPFFDRKD